MSAKNKCYNNLCIVVTLASEITFGLMFIWGLYTSLLSFKLY